MKKMIMIVLCASTLFANTSFEKNKEYRCLNTHNIQQGQEVNVDPKQANKQPFIFSIKDEKLVTNNNIVFDFKMQRGPMSSYSNAQYMLLLTPNLGLGLVPKKAKGSVQFYFDCKIK